MNGEVILLYVLRAIVTILGILVANIALKYFNQKALGMQTIFDEMIKDKIYLSLIACAFTIIMDVTIEYKAPLNHYVALPIIFCHQIMIISEIWQVIVIAVIRYLSVFYHPFLNTIDERLLKRMTRMFVGFISIMSGLQGDLENTSLYLLLTEKYMSSENLIRSKPIFVVSLICLTITIFTYYKIEMFKKYVDLKGKRISLKESEEHHERERRDCEFGLNTGRILLVIGCTMNMITIIYLLNDVTKEGLEIEDLIIKWHEAAFLIHFFDLNVFPMIFILRNERIFKFFKNQIKTFCSYVICCPLIVLNVLTCNQLQNINEFTSTFF